MTIAAWQRRVRTNDLIWRGGTYAILALAWAAAAVAVATVALHIIGLALIMAR